MHHTPGKTFFGSIATLIIAGFAVTALPLIVALVVGSVQVNHLTRQSERTILESAHATRASEFVADELVSMERNARQYAVLGNASLLKLYKERYAQLRDTLDQLENLGLGAANRPHLQAIRKLTAQVTSAIEQSPMDQTRVKQALRNFNTLRRYSADLRKASDAAMDEELAALSARSAHMQRTFLWQSVLLGAFGTALAAAFIVAILSPIRQINQSIARLGEEQFSEPIRVDGPNDLRAIGERLDWLRLRLQQVEQQKNEFVRHMSHELKTPLANIRESTGLLLDNTVGELSESQRDIVSILDSSGRRLHLLVDNLINLARWREHHAMTMGRFNATELVDRVVSDHRLLLDRKSLKLNIERPEDIPVYADEERLKTLLANLLSNAIKYAPDCSAIDVKLQVEDDNLALEVRDHGPGIPAEDNGKVFEPFYQSANSTNVEGTGIGLSVVRECIEAHGGCGEFLPCNDGAHFRAVLPIIERAADHA